MNEVHGLYLPDDPFFIKQIENGRGIFDRQSFEMCINHLAARGKKRRTVLDVGGHYGSWAVGFATHGFNEVHSFEPVKEIFDVLEQNAAHYNNIKIYNHGASFCLEYVDFEKGKDNSGQGHVSTTQNKGDILLKAIDSFNFKDVDLIKFDVEGYEYFALMGAFETIERCKPLLCFEFNGLSERYGKTDIEVIEKLNGIGYTLIDIKNKDYLFSHK